MAESGDEREATATSDRAVPTGDSGEDAPGAPGAPAEQTPSPPKKRKYKKGTDSGGRFAGLSSRPTMRTRAGDLGIAKLVMEVTHTYEELRNVRKSQFYRTNLKSYRQSR